MQQKAQTTTTTITKIRRNITLRNIESDKSKIRNEIKIVFESKFQRFEAAMFENQYLVRR